MNLLADTLLHQLNAAEADQVERLAEAYSEIAKAALSATPVARAKVILLRAALLEAASTLAANVDVDGDDLEASLAEAVAMLRHAVRRMCAGLQAHHAQFEGMTLQ